MRPTPRSRPSWTRADRSLHPSVPLLAGPTAAPSSVPPADDGAAPHPLPALTGMRPFGCHGFHDGRRRRDRHDTSPPRPRLRLTREGLGTLAFLLPFLRHLRAVRLVPDAAGGRDERAGDELRVSEPTFVGLENFARVLADPQFGIAVRNTAWFTVLALVFGFPVPIILARADERGPARPRAVQRPGLPAGRRAAGRVRAAVAVLLRRLPARRVQHDPRLGRPRAGPVAAGRRHGDAVDRHRGHVGGRRRDGHHLPGRAAQCPAGAVRRGRGRRRLDLAEDPLHHAAVHAQRAVRHADPAAHRHVAAVHRAVAVHRRRAGQLDPDRAAAHLPLRLPEQPRRRLRDGRRAEPDAGRVPGRVHRGLLLADPPMEHRLDDPAPTPRAPGRHRVDVLDRAVDPVGRRLAAASHPLDDARPPRRHAACSCW